MASNSTVPVDPASAFPQIPAGSTMGAWLLGVAGSLVLNGMIFHQTFRYFRLFPKDRTLLKSWVLIVMTLETLVTGLTLHTSYFYLVEKYWEPAYFFTSPTVWSLNILPIPGSIAALTSQSFFARRVWMISSKFRPLVIIAMMFISGNVVCFILLSSKMFTASNPIDALEYTWLASVGSAEQMVGDMMITATLIYVLRKSRTGIRKTDSMLDLLVMYACSTGLITCIVHILNVAFSIAWPENFVYAALSSILTKLYANTFLVALNIRKSLGILDSSHATADPPSRSRSSGPGGTRMSTSGTTARRVHNLNLGRVNVPMPSTPTRMPLTPIELKVVTEVITDRDAEDDDDALDSGHPGTETKGSTTPSMHSDDHIQRREGSDMV